MSWRAQTRLLAHALTGEPVPPSPDHALARRLAKADAPRIEGLVAAAGQGGARIDQPAPHGLAVDGHAGELVAELVELPGRRDADLAARQDPAQGGAGLAAAQALHHALAAARPRRAHAEDLVAVVADPKARSGHDRHVARLHDARVGRHGRL